MLRPVRPDELELLRDIERAAGELFRPLGMAAVADDEPPSVQTLASYCAAGRAWAATDEGRPVGYLLLDGVGVSAHVEQVTVHPAAARRGLGRLLIDAAGHWAASQGLRELTLTTFRDVAWNAPYYARIGFTVVPDDRLSDPLRKIREHEAALGLDQWPRVVMSRPVEPLEPLRP